MTKKDTHMKNDAMTMLEAVREVIGVQKPNPFATKPIEDGDIAVVLRNDGGIEILSTLPPEANVEVLAAFGKRATFALTLFKLAHDEDLMTDAALQVASEIDSKPESQFETKLN